MVKNKWLKSSLSLFVILSSSACNRAQNLENTFTFETGVEFLPKKINVMEDTRKLNQPLQK